MGFQTKGLKPKTTQKSSDNRGRVPPTSQTSRQDDVTFAVLAVVGPEPDDYSNVDDHPGSLDLEPPPVTLVTTKRGQWPFPGG